MTVNRIDGRSCCDLRPITFDRGYYEYAEGSVFVTWGKTRVICTATVEDKVPPFLRGSGSGWVTAEYAMLPRSTQQRIQRDVARGRVNGRGSEIQRLIGRSLRAAVKLSDLGEITILIDCDVIQADGGTRTASVTGGFIALADALRGMLRAGKLRELPLRTQIAAVSAGKVSGVPMLDLCYAEDSTAEADANIVMTSSGDFVEIQGTGEGGVFSRYELDKILDLARGGIAEIHAMQAECLAFTPEERAAMSI